MRASWKRRTAQSALAVCTFLLAQRDFSSAELNCPTPDSVCEARAQQAYWQALKLCQFESSSENADPRMRCYDNAREIYIRTLEGCRTRPPSVAPFPSP